MPRIRCLILDLDGTVIDSHAYTFAAFRHACAPFRTPPTDEEVYGLFGPAEQVILRDLVGPIHAAKALERLQEYYAQHVHEVPVHPEMAGLLAACGRAGVARGLFTGRGRDSTWELLRRLRLAESFDAIVAGDDAPPKPSGDGIALLLAKLGRAPEESLLVGDSPLDLRAAAAAGVSAYLAGWYERGARHAAAHRCVHEPAQLLALLAAGDAA